MKLHREKLYNAKPAIAMTSQRSVSTERKINKKKNFQLQEDRLTEIERANRMLYEKILKINAKPSLIMGRSSAQVS